MRDCEKISVYQELISRYNQAELFCSRNSQVYLEFTSKKIKGGEINNLGMSSRIFQGDVTEFRVIEGVSPQKAKKILSRETPCVMLPTNPMATTPIDSPECFDRAPLNVEIEKNDHAEIFRRISNKIEKEKMLKFAVQIEYSDFFIVNSRGIYGEGIRTYYAPGIEILDMGVFYKILPNKDFLVIDKLVDDIMCFREKKQKRINLFEEKIDSILFTSQLSGKLLYYFCCGLCANFIEANQSFYLNRKCKTQISEHVSVFINRENIIIRGNIDGEGIARRELTFIENGEIRRILSDQAHSSKYPSTGTACRFDYRTPAVLRPSSISCTGNIKQENLIKNFGNVLVINDISELEQNLRFHDLKFESPVVGEIYKSNEYKGAVKGVLRTSIMTILKNVLAVSEEGEYCLDGSVFCGAMIVPRDCVNFEIAR